MFMDILVFNWRDIKNPEAGGAEVHLHEVFKRIASNGHRVVLVASKFKGCEHREVIDGIETIRIGNKFIFNFAAIWHYITKLRKKDFDVVVDDVSKIPLFTPLYVKKPLIAIIHHLHGKTLFKELPFFMALYVYLTERLIPFLYNKTPFVAGSESTKEELIQMGVQGNIRVVPYGISHEKLFSGNKSEKPLLVYFGRVKAYKRLDHLVKAFRYVQDQIPESKLLIAGKGDAYGELKEVAERLNLEGLSFRGEISEEEMVNLLQQAWIFITPSMKEGWSITVIEANACGTPAIAYDVPGLRDSIRHGYNGLLVKNGDVEALADAMKMVLVDQELRERLSKNALEWAKQFSWDRSAEEFENVLRGLWNHV